ncbi:MAG TPA: hypothetical protein VFN49_03730 [Candidatus Aquilonibacter sp.]|nr:hypothetical protein [Candidatus Aquilonibacter sp.]
MTNVAALDAGLQAMRGGYASLRGQTYSVYRLSSATPGTGILTGTPVLVGYACAFRRLTSLNAIESTPFDLVCFEGFGDNRELQLGDVLVETGTGALPANRYTFAQARPTRESIYVRTEFLCSVGAPVPHAGAASAQPSSGWTYESGYGGMDDANVSMVELVSGVYQFNPTPGVAGASVPCGITPFNRVRDGSTLGTPTDNERARYVAYVPDLGSSAVLKPGYRLTVLATGESYLISSFINSEGAGLFGYVCLCEKV